MLTKTFCFIGLFIFFIILSGFSCRSDGGVSQEVGGTEGWVEPVCNVQKQDLKVVIEKVDGSQEEVSAISKIDVVNTSKIKFIVPEETKSLLKEIYSFPGQTGELVDPLLEPVEGWQAGQEYIIDLASFQKDLVMRYFICAENTTETNQQAYGCFPSCYRSRILFKVVEDN